MIDLSAVHYRYPGADIEALRDIALHVDRGAFVLVGGYSGSGKSTLLRTINGLVPHLSGGAFGGRVLVDGIDTRTYGPRALSRTCGFVFQDPDAQAVADSVEEEIAFSLEQMGVKRPIMRARVEEMLDLLGIAHLRYRHVRSLSGGERQRVAVASAMALHPQILVLDEPISQLDPGGADELVSAVSRLNDDLGVTIVLAEHRLDRFLPIADRLVWMDRGTCLTNDAVPAGLPVIPAPALPPMMQLARRLEILPAPMTTRDARRAFAHLTPEVVVRNQPRSAGAPAFAVTGAAFDRGNRRVLSDVNLVGRFGEVIAVIGRNGSGKTTLLRSLFGFEQPQSGRVTVLDRDMRRTRAQELGKMASYLPQRSGSVLFNESVRAELAFTTRHRGSASGERDLVDQLDLADLLDRDPRDLSEGQRLRAALAAVLVGEPRLVVLDEPTRGLDGHMKEHLVDLIRELRGSGACVVLSTHDIELAARVADRVVVLGGGGITADDEPHVVLGGSLSYSTQIRRIFGPGYLTLDDVVVPKARALSDT